MALLIALGILVLIIYILWVMVFIIFPLTTGASYERTDKASLKKMKKLARIRAGEKVAELGSGSGTVVIEFAKAGAKVTGYEINPFLLLWSRYKIKKLGLEKNAEIKWKNFWKVNLGDFDVVLVFQVGYIMKKLEKKLYAEARKRMRVVSNTWKFPEWDYKNREGEIYYYEIERECFKTEKISS